MTAPRCPVCLRVADVQQGRIVRHSRPPLGVAGVSITQWLRCEGEGLTPAAPRDTSPRQVLDSIAAAMAAGRGEGGIAEILTHAGYDLSTRPVSVEATIRELLAAHDAADVREGEDGPDAWETLDAIREVLPTEPPTCGHSACRQHWIDTGSEACIDGGGP